MVILGWSTLTWPCQSGGDPACPAELRASVTLTSAGKPIPAARVGPKRRSIFGMPSSLWRADCPNDAAPRSRLNGCHRRPVNGYSASLRTSREGKGVAVVVKRRRGGGAGRRTPLPPRDRPPPEGPRRG